MLHPVLMGIQYNPNCLAVFNGIVFDVWLLLNCQHHQEKAHDISTYQLNGQPKWEFIPINYNRDNLLTEAGLITTQ